MTSWATAPTSLPTGDTQGPRPGAAQPRALPWSWSAASTVGTLAGPRDERACGSEEKRKAACQAPQRHQPRQAAGPTSAHADVLYQATGAAPRGHGRSPTSSSGHPLARFPGTDSVALPEDTHQAEGAPGSWVGGPCGDGGRRTRHRGSPVLPGEQASG